ncbi:hypothetical protein HYPSUDRAFT_32263 [Hypholoma sublateritium FD-334 SS-4]|uniref:RING-type E3 ubiquitin transferase (cysteine targeting) n=1 Tax=Hypholoma sublateritium (strain FD-334 SS-4) TaxID=945553 RepID=A0A0D2N1C5_HYPSF|nr:hypothetical protein HYPSUDRAFT_32263 [Hypholoma sublateritium FD-334 SS-4]
MVPHATVLEDAWSSAQPQLEEVRLITSTECPIRPRIVRVGQLDAELLDKELAQLIQEPINKALSLLNTALRARFEPELNLFIQLTLYKLSVWNTGATYGAKLQDLRYSAPQSSSSGLAPSGLPRNRLLLHGTLTLILPYLHNRFRVHALSQAWPDVPTSDYRRKIWDALGSVESIHACLGLASFIAFLWNGKYRTIVDRLLKMSLVPSRRLVKRDISYEFMNRQMVWHAFTEFLLFLLPLISARTIRRKFYHLNTLLSSMSLSPFAPFRKLLGLQPNVKKGFGSQKRSKFGALAEDQCPICFENAQFNLNISEPTNLFTALAVNLTPEESSEAEPPSHPIYNPYQTSCGHIYCYHCIAERVMRIADEGDDESGWECLRCGEEVKEAHRYTVDIIEHERSESDYEFSSDIDMGTDLSGSMGSYSESGFSE